jgi:hypothetical protein
MTPVATPARQTSEQSDLAAMLGKLSISKGKAPEARTFSFATPITPANLSYLPPTNTGFGVPVGFGVATSTMYSPSSMGTIGAVGTMGMGSMLTGMTPQSTFPMAGSMAGFSPFAQTPYAGQGPSPIRFSQPEFGRPMGHQSFATDHAHYGSPSPDPSRQLGYSPRPIGPVRRQNAVKVPYHIAANYRSRNQNSSGGNHNFVDIENIQYGIDVRTTVSAIQGYSGHLMLTWLGHVEEHPKQGYPS